MTARVAMSPELVLDLWADHGPLVHQATNIPSLDAHTNGGPVFGERWFIAAPPDLGKTVVQVQFADQFEEAGVAVGLLGIDEEPSDLMMRLAQRRGWSRADCERRDPAILAAIRSMFRERAIRFYDYRWRIEEAADDLAAFAKGLGKRAYLGIDSLQTVQSVREDASRSLREQVTDRAWAIRESAHKHRMIVSCTSEMHRGAYRSAEAAEQSDDMASAKESGAVEYNARVFLSLRRVHGATDLVECTIVKNKHGDNGVKLYLSLDRGRQIFSEVNAPDVLDRTEAREQRKAQRARKKHHERAGTMAVVVTKEPGIGSRELRASMALRLGSCGADSAKAAAKALDKALVRYQDNKTSVVHHFVDGRAVPELVMAQLPAHERRLVAASRLPDNPPGERL